MSTLLLTVCWTFESCQDKRSTQVNIKLSHLILANGNADCLIHFVSVCRWSVTKALFAIVSRSWDDIVCGCRTIFSNSRKRLACLCRECGMHSSYQPWWATSKVAMKMHMCEFMTEHCPGSAWMLILHRCTRANMKTFFCVISCFEV